MIKEFELGTILTFTTDKTCTENIVDLYELALYIGSDISIDAKGLGMRKDEIKEHLLSIHPQLNGVVYNPQFETSFEAWLLSQKENYGEMLPVSKNGFALDGKVITKKLEYKAKLNISQDEMPF